MTKFNPYGASSHAHGEMLWPRHSAVCVRSTTEATKMWYRIKEIYSDKRAPFGQCHMYTLLAKHDIRQFTVDVWVSSCRVCALCCASSAREPLRTRVDATICHNNNYSSKQCNTDKTGIRALGRSALFICRSFGRCWNGCHFRRVNMTETVLWRDGSSIAKPEYMQLEYVCSLSYFCYALFIQFSS